MTHDVSKNVSETSEDKNLTLTKFTANLNESLASS